jgi:hypothetical protein
MAEVCWIFAERSQGRMRRVVALDDDFEVVSVHDRGGDAGGGGTAAASDGVDEVVLLRAADLTGIDF